MKYLIRALILQIRLLNNEEEKKKYNEVFQFNIYNIFSPNKNIVKNIID